MSNDHYSDSDTGEVKDHAVQQGREVRDHALDEAGAVKDHAAGAAREVAHTAGAEAKSVARDARSEFRGLVDSGLTELNSQAGTGQNRVAAQLREVVEELSDMVQGSQRDGMATQFAREISDRGHGLVSWLEDHEPREALDEVRRYASRNPWTFLALAAGAGLLVGRFARGLKDEGTSDAGTRSAGFSDVPGPTVGHGGGAMRASQAYAGTETFEADYVGPGDVYDQSGTGTAMPAHEFGYQPGEPAQGFGGQYGERQIQDPGERR